MPVIILYDRLIERLPRHELLINAGGARMKPFICASESLLICSLITNIKINRGCSMYMLRGICYLLTLYDQ